jgi:hypothetical protein
MKSIRHSFSSGLTPRNTKTPGRLPQDFKSILHKDSKGNKRQNVVENPLSQVSKYIQRLETLQYKIHKTLTITKPRPEDYKIEVNSEKQQTIVHVAAEYVAKTGEFKIFESIMNNLLDQIQDTDQNLQDTALTTWCTPDNNGHTIAHILYGTGNQEIISKANSCIEDITRNSTDTIQTILSIKDQTGKTPLDYLQNSIDNSYSTSQPRSIQQDSNYFSIGTENEHFIKECPVHFNPKAKSLPLKNATHTSIPSLERHTPKSSENPESTVTEAYAMAIRKVSEKIYGEKRITSV